MRIIIDIEGSDVQITTEPPARPALSARMIAPPPDVLERAAMLGALSAGAATARADLMKPKLEQSTLRENVRTENTPLEAGPRRAKTPRSRSMRANKPASSPRKKRR